jgi:hypothetical protein
MNKLLLERNKKQEETLSTMRLRLRLLLKVLKIE